MIFGGQHDQYQERYSTWAEAEEGHKKAIKLAHKVKLNNLLRDLREASGWKLDEDTGELVKTPNCDRVEVKVSKSQDVAVRIATTDVVKANKGNGTPIAMYLVHTVTFNPKRIRTDNKLEGHFNFCRQALS